MKTQEIDITDMMIKKKQKHMKKIARNYKNIHEISTDRNVPGDEMERKRKRGRDHCLNLFKDKIWHLN